MNRSDKISLYDDIRRQALLLGDEVIATRAWERLHALGAEEAPSIPVDRWEDKTIAERVDEYLAEDVA